MMKLNGEEPKVFLKEKHPAFEIIMKLMIKIRGLSMKMSNSVDLFYEILQLGRLDTFL
jgi:hypothetical protein